MTRQNLTIFFAALSMGACGGAQSSQTQTPAKSGEKETAAADKTPSADKTIALPTAQEGSARALLGIEGPETPWQDQGADEREFYMVGKYHPIMREIMAPYFEYRGLTEDQANKKLDCVTCHGADMREVLFKMPSGSLMQLPAPESEAWKNLEGLFPAEMQYMKEEVTPTSATLLGHEQGACNNCHIQN